MGRIQDALPTGQGLSEESFRERHAMALGAIALLTVILGTVGLVNGDSVIHVGFELLPVVLPGVYALRASHRLSSTIAAAWALMACSSLLVHQTDGLIESHFLFFVLLPLVALYQDWRAFLGSIARRRRSCPSSKAWSPRSTQCRPAGSSRKFSAPRHR